MASANLIFDILANDKSSRTLDGVSGNFSKLGDTAKRVGQLAAVGVLAVGAAALAWGKETAGALMEIERIGAQTDAVIASTGGAAGRTRDQIDTLAGSIEGLSGVEAETITEGQNLLLTFTNIKDANFDRATTAMTDMAVAMNGGSLAGLDMSSTATMMGKALNDPIAGIAAMSRVGVQFTEDQKDQIKTMVEMGDTAGAQTVILAELETQFGGSAAAAGDTAAGKFAKLKNTFGEISEQALGFLMPALEAVSDWLMTVGMPAFETVAGGVRALVAAFQAGGSDVTSSGFSGAMERVGLAARAVVDFFTGTVVPGIRAMVAAFQAGGSDVTSSGFAGVMERVGLAARAAADFFTGTVVPGVRALVAAFQAGGSDVTSSGFSGAMERVGLVARALVDFITGTVVPGFVSLVGWLKENATWLTPIVVGLAAMVAAYKVYTTYLLVVTSVTKAYAAVQLIWNAVMAANPIGIVILAIVGLVAAFVYLWNNSEAFRNFWIGAWDAIKAAASAVVSWFTDTAVPWLQGAWAAITGAFSSAVSGIRGFLQGAWDFMIQVFSWTPLGLIVANWDAIVGFFRGLPASIGNAVGGLWDGIWSNFRSTLNRIIGAWNDFKLVIGGGEIAGATLPSLTLNTPNIPLLATGGSITRGGFAIVGERGPELVNLPTGSTVFSNSQSFGRGKGNGLHIENYYAGSASADEVADALAWEMMR